MWEALKSSLINSSSLWFLLLLSLYYEVRDLLRKKALLSNLVGLLCFIGIFGYLVFLFDMGMRSWIIILNDSITFLPKFGLPILRMLSLWGGYTLAKKYVVIKEKPKKPSALFRFFNEFIAVCGGIAGFFVQIILLLLLRIVL